FYGEGPKGNVNITTVNTNINPYTDKAYYYVNISPGYGKRMQSMVQPEANADFTVQTFQDYQFHEIDEYNMAKLGRRWFGDRFGIENEKSFEFEFPNLIASEHAKIKVYLGATAEVATTMGVSLNETLIATVPLIAFAGNSLASVNHYVGDQ